MFNLIVHLVSYWFLGILLVSLYHRLWLVEVDPDVGIGM